MPYATLDAAIRAYIVLGTTLPPERVVPGIRGAPVPDNAFCTVIRTDDIQRGSPIIIERQDQEIVRLLRRATYVVSFHREDAAEIAEGFIYWTASDVAVIEAQRRDFTVWEAKDVRDLSTLQEFDQTFEAAANLEMLIDYVNETGYDSGRVEALDITIRESGGDDIALEISADGS